MISSFKQHSHSHISHKLIDCINRLAGEMRYEVNIDLDEPLAA